MSFPEPPPDVTAGRGPSGGAGGDVTAGARRAAGGGAAPLRGPRARRARGGAAARIARGGAGSGRPRARGGDVTRPGGKRRAAFLLCFALPLFNEASAFVVFNAFSAVLLLRASFGAFLLLYPNVFPTLNTFYSIYFSCFMYLPYLMRFQYSVLRIPDILYFQYILP